METADHAASTPRPHPGERFRQNPRVAQQVLGGKAVILHYEGKRMLGLNPSGSEVWSRLDGRRSLQEIGEELARLRGAPVPEVVADLLDFVAGLQGRDLVTNESNSTPEEGRDAESGGLPRPEETR
jgi:hypothetical protein